MSSIPLPALAVNPPTNPVDQFSKLVQLKSLLQGQQAQQQEMSQRAQLFPSQLSQQQSAASQAGAQSQMTQLGLQNMQRVNAFMTDPTSGKKFDAWQKSQGSQPTPGWGQPN